MSQRKKLLLLLLMIVFGSLAVACGQTTSQAPDSSAMATQVAQQIYATLTAEADYVPTVTPTPSSTPTRPPVVTPKPQVTQTPEPTATPKPKPTPKPTATPTARKPSPTSTPRPTPTPKRQPSLGDVVRCDDVYEISVILPPSFAKELNVLDTGGYLTFSSEELAKGEWMLVFFTLTNLQAKTDRLSSWGDELLVQGVLDGRTVAFSPSSWGTSRADRAQGISDWNDDIPPGVTITALAIFDVNPEATELELVLQPEEGFTKVCEAIIGLEQQADLPGDQPIAIASSAINIRSGPGTDYPVAGKARAGQRFVIIGRSKDATWWQVSYNGQTGWVAGSVVTTAGPADTIPETLDIPAPPATSTPLPKVRPEQESIVSIWGLRLYDVKKAKAVYFFGRAEVANGVWLIPFVEFRNVGSGTAQPHHNLDFYLQDAQGRTYDFDPFDDAVLGAAWQFQAGHLYDDINPGLKLGIAMPFDVPSDLGDVWLRVRQDRNTAFYLGNISGMPETK